MYISPHRYFSLLLKFLNKMFLIHSYLLLRFSFVTLEKIVIIKKLYSEINKIYKQLHYKPRVRKNH